MNIIYQNNSCTFDCACVSAGEWAWSKRGIALSLKWQQRASPRPTKDVRACDPRQTPFPDSKTQWEEVVKSGYISNHSFWRQIGKNSPDGSKDAEDKRFSGFWEVRRWSPIPLRKRSKVSPDHRAHFRQLCGLMEVFMLGMAPDLVTYTCKPKLKWKQQKGGVVFFLNYEGL